MELEARKANACSDNCGDRNNCGNRIRILLETLVHTAQDNWSFIRWREFHCFESRIQQQPTINGRNKRNGWSRAIQFHCLLERWIEPNKQCWSFHKIDTAKSEHSRFHEGFRE